MPGRGQWEVEVERKATHDLGVLTTALRRPDAGEGPAGLTCPADAILLPELVLEDRSGALLRPSFPIDDCDQPQTAALNAVDRLPWTTVSSHLIQQVETQAELVSGCGPSFKDLFDLYATSLVPAGPGAAVPGHPTILSVCVFRDNPATNFPDGLTGPDPVGSFVGGGSVNGSTETALLKGISGGRATASCSQEHPEFAVISAADQQPSAFVELGACDRVLRISYVTNKAEMVSIETNEIGQATPTAVALIERVATTAG